MFEPVSSPKSTSSRLQFTFDGEAISAEPGMTIAAALLAADKKWFRETQVSGRPRGPYCLMGACYDCLVTIGGVTVQACMTEVGEGLIVTSIGRRAADQ